jgi:hypothetical protein
MQNFYDLMPTQIQFENFVSYYEQQNKDMRENSNYRMENYFNCVDDYSWGGICDKAANIAYGKRFRIYNNLVTQMRDGAFIEDIELSVLVDFNGNIVSDKIVNGKFGQCWIIENGDSVNFVGVAKKQSTYNKKGYKVMTLINTIEYYYLTNGKVISRLLDEQLVDVMMDTQTTFKPIELYTAINS